jgi:CBS domain-containing protein
MYRFLDYRVGDVMTHDVVAIHPETPIAEVEEIFDAKGFEALPVLDAAGALVGIVSRLDVLRAFHFTPESIVPHYDEIRRRTARSVMTLQPFAVEPGLPLTRLLETLVATRVKSLPVVEKGRLVGMVSREDVIRALRRAAADEGP